MYYSKYIKYKSKYLNYQKGGSIQGAYYKDGKQYKVMKTYEKKYVSYHEGLFSSQDSITVDVTKPDTTKVLLIDDLDTFDLFTNKYGFYKDDLETCYIRWDKVERDYKGFYLNQLNNKLLGQRHQYVFYKTYRLNSWWEDEYNVSGVMMFDKE